MRKNFFFMLWLSGLCGLFSASQAATPFESESDFTPQNEIDKYVLAVLRQRGLTPAKMCSDAVFVRRAYFDVIGTIPSPQEAEAFLKDTRPDKRARLIDALLQREEFAQYWGLKWGICCESNRNFPSICGPMQCKLMIAGYVLLYAKTSLMINLCESF